MDGFTKRQEADQKFLLVVARSQAIWQRCDPKRIPTAESLLRGGKRTRSGTNDLAANARAWIAVLKQQQRNKPE